MPMSVQLPISETFTSIQGEGKLAGVPSWFVRVSGCNLRCSWCDTPYASWDVAGHEPAKRTIGELVGEAVASGVKHAVVTGGEPMMFEAITPLTITLREAGFHVTIETAGTICPTDPPLADLMSISPKLASSTPRNDSRDPLNVWSQRHDSRRLNLPVLQSLIERSPSFQLKFVLTASDRDQGRRDLAEIESLLAQLRGWKPADILLMPEGVAMPARDDEQWAVRECIARGWRYCPRLHIMLFGHTRGT